MRRRFIQLCLLVACAIQIPTIAGAVETTPIPFRKPAYGRTQAADRVLVGVRPGTGAAGVRALGVGVQSVSTTLGVVSMQVPDGESAEQYACELGAMPGVRYAEPVVYYEMAAVPNDPKYALQWNLRSIGIPYAWDSFGSGTGAKLAVLDSGYVGGTVDLLAHEPLEWYDAVDHLPYVHGSETHGTQVASVAAATTDNRIGIAGVAGACDLMAVKVLDDQGQGESQWLAEGIVWAADHGADVMNLSLSGRSYSQVVADAVAYALSKDCVIVAAAGNDGANLLSYPAAYPGVVSVGSVRSSSGSLTRSWFSNFAPGLDLVAPGERVLTAHDTTVSYADGTSFSAPQVSGLFTLARSRFPLDSRERVEDVVLHGARDLGRTGYDRLYGRGSVWGGLDFKARRTRDVDAELPGTPAPSAQITGQVDTTSDLMDTYELHLLKGQTLAATLNADPSSGATLQLYGWNAMESAPPAPVRAVTAAPVAPSLSYTAPRTGSYSLRVRCATGTATYDVRYAVADNAQPDDDIPGVVRSMRYVDSLDRARDIHDVSRVYLQGGEGLTVKLISSEVGSDFDLLLFNPSGGSISAGSARLLAYGGQTGRRDFLSYSVSIIGGGVYYLDASAWAGTGNYSIQLVKGTGTKASISVPPTYPYGSRAKITGRLFDINDGRAVAGRRVNIWAQPSTRTTFTKVASVVTDSYGRYTYYAAPRVPTWYAVEFIGDASGQYTACGTYAYPTQPVAR